MTISSGFTVVDLSHYSCSFFSFISFSFFSFIKLHLLPVLHLLHVSVCPFFLSLSYCVCLIMSTCSRFEFILVCWVFFQLPPPVLHLPHVCVCPFFLSLSYCFSLSASAPPCAAGKVHQSCGTYCPITCQNKDGPPQACPSVCVSGCFCAAGTILNTVDDTCVPEANCPGECVRS